MAFGIGTNTQAADAGPVKGNQSDVACLCWFDKTRKIIIELQDYNHKTGD